MRYIKLCVFRYINDYRLSVTPGMVGRLSDRVGSPARRSRDVHAGAGAAGLRAAFKMERQLMDHDPVCYETNGDVRTWLQNWYLGCACNVPRTSLAYTFEPWSHCQPYYAHSTEIHRYSVNVRLEFVALGEKHVLLRTLAPGHRQSADLGTKRGRVIPAWT